MAERVSGQLNEAIQYYQRILDKFSSDRALAAKALLQRKLHEFYQLAVPAGDSPRRPRAKRPPTN